MTTEIAMRRRTLDGIIICVWDDGAITGAVGKRLQGVPIARPRTQNARARQRLIASLVAGDVELYREAELGDLYRAACFAADRDGLPKTMRERFAATARSQR